MIEVDVRWLSWPRTDARTRAMADKSSNSRSSKAEGITNIRVEGFKSLMAEQSIAVKPLTILAGANSSGKSSIMQPLLLMKQTLEAPYDPGVFKLDGPNVVFSSFREMMPYNMKNISGWTLAIEVAVKGISYRMTYGYKEISSDFSIFNLVRISANKYMLICEGALDKRLVKNIWPEAKDNDLQYYGFRDRFYLNVGYTKVDGNESGKAFVAQQLIEAVADFVHISGSRKRQARSYPSINTFRRFPGLFEEYTASIIQHWQKENGLNYNKLNLQLEFLGLTPRIQAMKVDDTRIEVFVAPKGGTISLENETWLNIADVGVGVFQVLPVLVAMLAAQPEQLVYIEEPELHLHPRAQWRLASIMAEAAKRGVRLVIETHSSVLIRGIQTLVAKGELDPELVALHWFTLDPETGATTVSSAEMDANGAYGDWPEDFDDTALDVERQYYDAVEKRMFTDD